MRLSPFGKDSGRRNATGPRPRHGPPVDRSEPTTRCRCECVMNSLSARKPHGPRSACRPVIRRELRGRSVPLQPGPGIVLHESGKDGVARSQEGLGPVSRTVGSRSSQNSPYWTHNFKRATRTPPRMGSNVAPTTGLPTRPTKAPPRSWRTSLTISLASSNPASR